MQQDAPQLPAARDARPRGDIAMVAVDLDGTLLNDSKQIGRQTVQALACLPAQGIKVVIASARPPRSVRQVYQLLELETWQINYNGALIWDEPGNQVVHHVPLDGPHVWAIVQRARALFPDCLVSCEILDQWFTDRHDQSYTTETGRLFRPNFVVPLQDFCSQAVTKLLILGPVAMMNALTPLLREEFHQAAVIRSDPELIQIMNPLASKATALEIIAEAYQVPMSRVLAIGDAVNDLPMIQAAGVGVAMDNAHPTVKQHADWVAPSNNDHGVHATLVRYGLCP